MTLLIVLALAVVAGMRVPRWSMAFVPVVTGATLIVALVAAGRDVRDTPIPFLVVAATVAIAAGVLVRSRRLGRQRSACW
jgi:hypothetical protein